MRMQKLTVVTGLLWLVVAIARGDTLANANPGQLFQFRFEQKRPLVYAVEFKSQGRSDGRAGQRSSLTSNSIDLRYKMRLSESRKNQDGTTTVYFEPFDFEQDNHSTGQNGQIDTIVRGLHVISKQNGIVMVDSETGIGLSQVQMLKQSAYGNLLSGYFHFDSAGHIKKYGGDLPFVDVWENNLKNDLSLFHIVFPTNPIAVRDSWTNYVTLKSNGVMVFAGDGMVQPWVFTRDPDQTESNGSIASFTLNEMDVTKDVSAYLDQSGQRASILIPEHHERMDATYRFDQKRGCLISMTKSDRRQDTMSMILQGTSMETHLQTDTDISITLITQ